MPLSISTALRADINVQLCRIQFSVLLKKIHQQLNVFIVSHVTVEWKWIDTLLEEENYPVKIEVHVKCLWRRGTEKGRRGDDFLPENYLTFSISTQWSWKEWSLSTAHYEWLIFVINTRSYGGLINSLRHVSPAAQSTIIAFLKQRISLR